MPFEGISVSDSRVKADSNCLLQILALSRVSVYGQMSFSSQRVSIYLSLLSRSFSDHHFRCGGWLNLEFSKRQKPPGWAIKTIYKK